MIDLVELGNRIKKQRELLGYTREHLAELVNVTPRFCYDLELGLKGMSLETLCNLSRALNISTDYLLFGPKKDENLTSINALIATCPPDKRTLLDGIVSNFIQAVR